MATLTNSPQSILAEQVIPYLNKWEDFYVTDRYGEYIVELRTSIMVHRRHTSKDLFTQQSFMSAFQINAIPNLEFLKEWLKNARKATTKTISKGEYSVEKLINGEWQSVKAHFNRWIYYDRNEQLLCGKVKEIV